MFIYDANVKHVQLLRKRFKTNFSRQLVDQAVTVDTMESFKLTCDVASVLSLLFTPNSFVREQPVSAIMIWQIGLPHAASHPLRRVRFRAGAHCI